MIVCHSGELSPVGCTPVYPGRIHWPPCTPLLNMTITCRLPQAPAQTTGMWLNFPRAAAEAALRAWSN
jgi:hypothetical protein